MIRIRKGTCTYCGAEIGRNSYFCKGHNIAMKRRYLYRYNVLREQDGDVAYVLNFFNWLSNNSSSTTTVFSETNDYSLIFRKFGIEVECNLLNRNNIEHTSMTKTARVSKVLEVLQESGIDIQNDGYTHRTLNRWKLVTDGSLDGEKLGREIVSPPISSEAGFNEIKTICEVLDREDVTVDRRCSCHIHLDASDLRPEDFVRIFKFYKAFEGELDKMFPRSRRENNNTYCNSFKHRNFDNCRTISDIRSVLSHDRYYKVNIEAYFRHGTIEFRQHAGTINFNKIKYWVMFCTRIVNFAKSNKPINTSTPMFTLLNLSEEEKEFWRGRMEDLNAA